MFCALLGQDIGERLQDHWSSGLNFVLCNFANVISRKEL